MQESSTAAKMKQDNQKTNRNMLKMASMCITNQLHLSPNYVEVGGMSGYIGSINSLKLVNTKIMQKTKQLSFKLDALPGAAFIQMHYHHEKHQRSNRCKY